MEEKKEIISILEKYKQKHIIKHLNNLSYKKADIFFNNISVANLNLTFDLFSKEVSPLKTRKKYKDIKPPYLFTPTTIKESDNLYKLGETYLSSEKNIAVMVVAGGQATRLGHPYSKGMYPISPIKRKTLFRLFSEKIKAISLKYKIEIPFLIMGSPENHLEIKEFFKKNHFFGLDPKNVFFFQQGFLPSITPEGNLLVNEDGQLLTNPDGHGGSLKAVYKSGLLNTLEEKGVKMIFYCHIDNPLIKILDPFFIGCHLHKKADFSLKTIKRGINEKVGTYVYVDNKASIIEYIELPNELRNAKDKEGNLLFGQGNTGIHIINTEFIKKLNKNSLSLPYHKQNKKILLFNKEMDIWKFETFIFDAIPLAERVCCVETNRLEEFAPLKNKRGKDSPLDVKRKMSNLYKEWFKEAGIKVAEDIIIEISPLFAHDKRELINKAKMLSPTIKETTYIE